jgi:AraC-like DNA-binding protein
MVLPVDGVMEIKVGNVGGWVSPNQGVMIACGERHVFRTRGANHFIVLDIPREKFPALTPQSPFFGIDQTLTELTRYAGSELLTGALEPEGEYHLAALITGKLRRSLIASSRPSGPIDGALAIMHERYGERLTATELAKAVGLGASRFHELFRRETGRTPAEMLAGYSEQSALTRSLRKRRGTTPHVLRGVNSNTAHPDPSP